MRIQFQKAALLFILVLSIIDPGLLAQSKSAVQKQVDSLNTLFNQVEETDLHRAELLVNSAIKIAEEEDYIKGMADAQSNLGTVYVRQGNFKQAIDHYFSAIKQYDQVGGLSHTKNYAAALVRLSGAFCLEEDFDRALTYSDKAVSITTKNKYYDLSGIAYRIKGETFRGLGNLDSSSHYFQLALLSFGKTNNLTHLGSVYTDIGINYYYINDYKQALIHTQKAFALTKQANNKTEYPVLLHNMGEFSYLLKSYQQALFYLDSAQYYGEYFKASGNLMDTYKVKAQVYKALGNIDSVGHYYEKTLQLRDSLYNDTYKKELAALQTQSDVYKKETENKLLAKDKRIALLYRNLAIAAIVGLVILLGFILLNQRLRIQRRVKNQLEEEVALRTKEIFRQKETIFHANLRLKLALNGAKFDSHFVFNVLNAIQSVVLQKKPLEAQDYLAKLSRLMRYTLEKSPLNLVPLSEELEMTERYIQLEQLRLDQHFNYTIVCDADELTMIPALLLQPYVENAILHGLAPATSEKLLLEIGIEEKNELLTITITDNGVGRKKIKRNNHSSQGQKIGQERLDMLTHLTHKNHLISIEDLVNEEGDNAGTKVTLQIPIEKQPINYELEPIGETLEN
jgi:tetratricopeptide (TPR) repeat protein